MTGLDEKIKARRESLEVGSEKVADPSRGIDERIAERQRLMEQGVHAVDPRTLDARSRQEFLAKQVGQEILGQPALGTPGLEDFGTRFDLGLSDTFLEKKTKFLDKYPEGEFVEVFEPSAEPSNRATTILFRRHPDEPYAELDARALDRWEVLMDLGDVSGEIPSAVLEAVTVRGARLVQQLWKTAAATVGGDALKESVEEARGYQLETLPELASRETKRAIISTVGAGATVVVSGPLNAVRGASSIKIAKSAPAAQKAAKKLGVPGLLPSQIARSPLVRKMGGQAGAVMSTINDYINNQQAALVRALTRLRSNDLARVMRGEIEGVHEEAREQIIKAAQLSPNRSLTEAGTAIQEGLAEYDALANMLVDRAYQRARMIEAPEFDITSLKATARELKAGVRAAAEEGGEVQLSQPQKDLLDLLDKIEQVDPSLPSVTLPDGRVIDAVDQLRAIRSQLWDMKTPPPGEIARQSEREAGKLYGAVTHVLRNPKNTNPEFVNAWRMADATAAGRFDTMEKLIVVQSAKSETPAQMAERLVKPNQVDNLRILKNSMPDSRWGEFREAVKSDMLSPNKVDNLTKRLDTFDQNTLDALLPRQDQALLREIGGQIDKLNQVGVKEALTRQTQRAALLSEWIDSGQTARISGLVELANKNPLLRDSIRAGLMERVFANVVDVREGVRTINRTALQQEMRALRDSGALKFLKFNDIRTLKEIDTILEFVPARPDSGTSLQAGQAVAGARGLSVEAFQTILEHIGTGRLMTSEIFQRAMLGSGRKKSPFNSLRVIGSILARTATELESEQRQQQER